MDNLLVSLDSESKAYSTKLRLEIQSLQLLTSKILSEVENNRDHKTCKEIPKTKKITTSKLILADNSNISAILYENINKYMMALIKYFDCKEEVRCHFVMPTIIQGPQYFHLPTLCNMLWRRILIVNSRSRGKNKVSTPTHSKGAENVSLSYKSSQTETCSLMYCENCSLSTELVKSLIHLILEAQNKYNVDETNVSNFRERVRHEVFEMSQWGVMRGWAAAVRSDVEWLLSLAASSLRKRDQLCQELEALKQENGRNKTALQNDIDLTRTQLQAGI